MTGPTALLTWLAVLQAAPAGWSVPRFQFFPQMTEEQEIAIGRSAAREVEREKPLLRNRRVNAYAQRLGAELARHSRRRDLTHRFKIIDEGEVNAFALPGGFIYLNRGIMELAENESELAGVLAHEIAHVSERHGVEQVHKAQRIGLGLSLLELVLGRTRNTAENLAALGAGLLGQGIFFKYSRDAEREADREGVRVLRSTGINSQGMVTLFQRMETVRRNRPGLVDKFFSSHPSLNERQENISEVLRSSDSSLRSDSREFRQIKRSLKP